MELGQIAQLATLVSMLGGLIVFVIRSARAAEKQRQDDHDKTKRELDILKKELLDRIEKVEGADRNKRGKIYDEVRAVETRIEEKFVRKDMCQILHGQLKEAVMLASSDLKRILEREEP